MKHVKALQRSLSPYFNLSHYRLECLCQFVLSMLMVNDVNLSKIAPSFCSKAKVASNYKRLQRFIKSLNYSFSAIWKLVDYLFELPEHVHFALDRTNWKFGCFNINYLVLAVVYKGTAIPICWSLLNKRGNSNYQERLCLINRLLGFVPKSRFACLLADREFVGNAWLQGLKDLRLSFVIRCKANMLVSNTKGKPLPVGLMLRGVKPGKWIVLPRKRMVMGQMLFVVATRLPDGELLILLCDDEPEKAADRYALRWEIEHLFSCLKRRGFNFENTHLKHEDRLSNLMFVLTIAFIWAYRQGEIVVEKKSRRLKKHGYPEKSLFKIGLEEIKQKLFNCICSTREIIQAIRTVFGSTKKYSRLRQTSANLAGVL